MQRTRAATRADTARARRAAQLLPRSRCCMTCSRARCPTSRPWKSCCYDYFPHGAATPLCPTTSAGIGCGARSSPPRSPTASSTAAVRPRRCGWRKKPHGLSARSRTRSWRRAPCSASPMSGDGSMLWTARSAAFQLELYSRIQERSRNVAWFLRHDQLSARQPDAAIATHARRPVSTALIDGLLGGGDPGSSAPRASSSRRAEFLPISQLTWPALRSWSTRRRSSRLRRARARRTDGRARVPRHRRSFPPRDLLAPHGAITVADDYDRLAIAGAEQALADARRSMTLASSADAGGISPRRLGAATRPHRPRRRTPRHHGVERTAHTVAPDGRRDTFGDLSRTQA